MTPQLAEELLTLLASGEADTAARIFMAYEPYLRRIIRRHIPAGLRSKFDSVDVMQSAWGDIVKKLQTTTWRFESPAQLQAFLTRVVRNRCFDRLRHHRHELDKEHPLDLDDSSNQPPCATPSPGEVIEAADLWDRILSLAPAEHHELLRLKRDGASASEIASRTGLHAGSVRRILRQLATRLALADPEALLVME